VPDPIPVYIHLLHAKDLIDREYARPLEVATLARESHASAAHFSRSFKRAFGETPHKYLVRRRIERAKELLRGTDLSVTEVPRFLQLSISRTGRRVARQVRPALA
jgi:AraC-like DNA-binding protein